MKNLLLILVSILALSCNKSEPVSTPKPVDPCINPTIPGIITITAVGNPNISYKMDYEQGSNSYGYILPKTFTEFKRIPCSDNNKSQLCGSFSMSVFPYPKGTDTIPYMVYVTLNNDTIIRKSSTQDSALWHSTVFFSLNGCY